MNPTKVTEIRTGWNEHYFWRTDTQLCFFRPVSRGEHKPTFDLVELDTTTGQVRELAVFNAACAPALHARSMSVRWQGRPGEELHHDPPWFAVSNDGKWLSWCTYFCPDGSDPEPRWFAGSLEEPLLHSWLLDPNPTGGRTSLSPPLWSSGSRRCIALNATYHDNDYFLDRAILRDVEGTEAAEIIDLPSCPAGLHLGLDSEGCMIIRHPDHSQQPAGHASFRRLPLAPLEAVPAEYRIPLPAPAYISNVSLSPDARRLAWVLSGPDRWNDPFEIWVSDLKGEGMCRLLEIAPMHESTPERVPGFVFHFPRELQWLPSGQAVSYLFHHAIWSLSV